MTQEEFDKLVEKVGEKATLAIKEKVDAIQAKLDSQIAEAMKNNATKEEVKTLVAEAAKEAGVAAKEALKAEYDEVLRKQGEAIGELKDQIKAHKGGMAKGLMVAIKEAFEAQKETISAIVKSGGKQPAGPLVVTIDKAAIDMSEENTIGSGDTQVLLTQNTGIYSQIRRREEKYLQSVSTGNITNARALWVEETDDQGVPIFIAEGDAKIKLSTKWVEKTADVKKIAAYGKVTTELMDDLPQLLAYIKNTLLKRLGIATETALFSGNNVGDNLNGATNLASAFTGGGLAGLVEDPNEFDVLTSIALQVKVAFGIPNAIYINPVTWALMQTLKDEQGRPIWKDYVVAGGEIVFAGMKIIESTAVTAGEFVGGDMTVLNVLFREQLTIQIGLDGNDFINNKKTILAESRLVQFASANDTPCIVKGVFADAITTIALPNP